MNSFPHEVSRLIKMSKVKDATRGTTTPGNDLSEKGRVDCREKRARLLHSGIGSHRILLAQFYRSHRIS